MSQKLFSNSKLTNKVHKNSIHEDADREVQNAEKALTYFSALIQLQL